jgi:hypothetical protein
VARGIARYPRTFSVPQSGIRAHSGKRLQWIPPERSNSGRYRMMPGASKDISTHVTFLSVIGSLPYKRKMVIAMTRTPYKTYIHRIDCVPLAVTSGWLSSWWNGLDEQSSRAAIASFMLSCR